MSCSSIFVVSCKTTEGARHPIAKEEIDQYYLSEALSKVQRSSPCNSYQSTIMTRTAGVDPRISSILVSGCERQEIIKVLCPGNASYPCVPNVSCHNQYPCVVLTKDEEAAYNKRKSLAGPKTFKKRERRRNLDRRHRPRFR